MQRWSGHGSLTELRVPQADEYADDELDDDEYWDDGGEDGPASLPANVAAANKRSRWAQPTF